jgi:hypothetical protein
MEVASSAIASALRIGVNIIVNQNRPVLEFYHEVHNTQGPPVEFEQRNAHGMTLPASTHRFSEQYIAFTLVNIGGIRGENVLIRLTGEFKRDAPRGDWGEKFGNEHAQMAPGQSVFLFRLDTFDLLKYPPGGGQPIGNKEEKLILVVEYNGPSSGLNWLFRLPSRIRRKSQYKTIYVFDPKNVMGDLPPVRYA